MSQHTIDSLAGRTRDIEIVLWGRDGTNGVKGEVEHQRRAMRKVHEKIDASDAANEQRYQDLYSLLAKIGIGVILGLLAILGTLIVAVVT